MMFLFENYFLFHNLLYRRKWTGKFAGFSISGAFERVNDQYFIQSEQNGVSLDYKILSLVETQYGLIKLIFTSLNSKKSHTVKICSMFTNKLPCRLWKVKGTEQVMQFIFEYLQGTWQFLICNNNNFFRTFEVFENVRNWWKLLISIYSFIFSEYFTVDDRSFTFNAQIEILCFYLFSTVTFFTVVDIELRASSIIDFETAGHTIKRQIDSFQSCALV